MHPLLLARIGWLTILVLLVDVFVVVFWVVVGERHTTLLQRCDIVDVEIYIANGSGATGLALQQRLLLRLLVTRGIDLTRGGKKNLQDLISD